MTTQQVFYMVSADDLREMVREIYCEEQKRTAQTIAQRREQPTVTRHQAARMLNVTLSTLWRWAKDGYLVPVKIGSKVLYRQSDIDRMLTRAQEGGMP